MFRLLDLIASMVRHHPVHSAAIANRVLQTIPRTPGRPLLQRWRHQTFAQRAVEPSQISISRH
jgi:hypothetical protein